MIKSEFVLSCDPDNVGKAISERFLIEQGYNTARTGRTISVDVIEDFIVELKINGFDVSDLRGFNYSISAFSADKSMYVYMDISGQYTDVYVKDGAVDQIAAFYTKYSEYFEYTNPDFVGVHYYFHHPTYGTNERFIHVAKDDIQHTIPEMYPDYDVESLTEQYLASRDNILLLYGKPGVGKTQFLRYVMKQGAFENIVYVKDTEVINSGDFWSNMTNMDADLIIFDDMDDALCPRKKGDRNNTFMSNVLSFTDGIFEKKTKIIITTNKPIKEIDAAAIRPGRCFDFLTLNPLTYDEAREIWVNVLSGDEGQFVTLYGGSSEITQASLMSDYERMQLSFVERTYIKKGDVNYNLEKKMKDSGITVS